jgi:hypothetical protein
MRNALMATLRERHERLAWARESAGFETASNGAEAVSEKIPTYLGHENGSRGFGRKKTEKYARRFRVSYEWLDTGRGEPRPKPRQEVAAKTVPLVGFVAAGAEAHFMAAGELGDVEAPAGSTESTVAVEMRGESWGTFFDRWLVYYDEVRRPVTSDLIGKPCVVGLEDGRVLVKRIQRSRTRGLFHLYSPASDPINDVAIEWAAKVKNMVPR